MTTAENQTEIPEIQETFNDELSRAVHDLHRQDAVAKESKEALDAAKQKVVIEMKKAGKDYLKIQLNGEMWEVEVKRTEEKLSFKKSRA